MLISVVTTSFNSSNHISKFLRQVEDLFFENNLDYEIIIVDDGSSDDSIKKIQNIQKQTNKITLIELSRNFGHHPAISCGLKHAIGDLIFLIDSDLEEEPKIFNKFYKELNANDLDLVFGRQKSRRGGLLEKISGNLYYFFLNKILGFKIPKNMVTSRLMRREYLDAYLQFKESEFLLSGITELTGFKKKGIFVEKIRKYKTNYNSIKKMQVLVKSITNYSSRPLYFLFYFGLIISIISFCIILYLIFLGFVREIEVSGWLTLACLSWLGVGITVLSNGIIAIYIKTIFLEVKKRPITIIRRIHKNKIL